MLGFVDKRSDDFQCRDLHWQLSYLIEEAPLLFRINRDE